MDLKATWSMREVADACGWADARSARTWLESEGVKVHERGGRRRIAFVFLSDLVAVVPAFTETLELVMAGRRNEEFGRA